MPDPRFFDDLGPTTIGELVELTGAAPAQPARPDAPIRSAAPLDRAGADGVSFFADRRYRDALKASGAGACFLPPANAADAPEGCVALVTREPQVAYAKAASRLYRPRRSAAGGPLVDPSAELEEGVLLGHGAVIGPGARIGRGSYIGAYSVIGPGVAIGRGCSIEAHVSIGFALIGDNVRILAGARIGEAGFGIGAGQAGAIDLPQLGRVILQDAVTVGANSCIDRGAFDDTVVGENTKIDNQVQIGHNVRLGRNCVLCGHVGISGSSIVGDGVQFGAKAGIADHVTIGDGARIIAAAGVMHDVPAGETWGGAPAIPVRKFMRQVAWLARMAEGRSERARHDQT
jgi:UDP-3-O-[3-hydroxymyristoyl] glucosamine N-acyltransferase